MNEVKNSMKYQCQKCGWKGETYAEAKNHSEATLHAYKKVYVDSVDLKDEATSDFLKQKYEEQVKYAIDLFRSVTREIASEIIYADKDKQTQFEMAIFSAILDKTLTPAVYLKDDLPKKNEEQKKQ